MNLATERCRDHSDRHLAVQIVTVALEHLVLAYADLDIQVARRPTIDAWLAVAGRADAHAVIDTGRDLDLKRLVALDPTHAIARAAGVGNRLALPSARGASLLNRKEALLHADRALAIAGPAGFGPRSGLGACALAGVAGFPAGHANLGGMTRCGLLERDLHRVSKISAAIDAAAPATTTVCYSPSLS